MHLSVLSDMCQADFVKSLRIAIELPPFKYRIGHSQRSGHSQRTGRSQRTGHSQGTDHSQRTGHSHRTGHSRRTGHSHRTGHSQRTSHSQRAGHSQRTVTHNIYFRALDKLSVNFCTQNLLYCLPRCILTLFATSTSR